MELVNIDYAHIKRLTGIIDIRIYADGTAPRGTAFLDIASGWLAVHPDDEHVVWAELGQIGRAFEVLNRRLGRRIDTAAGWAHANVKYPGQRVRVRV